MEAPQPFLPKKGNYEDLACYKKATVIYDLTYFFTQKFLLKSDRTIDQMVQAARSGKQNIAEGSAAAATSAATELKLTNVARASMKELLGKYINHLDKTFVEQGGIRERMTAARLGYRGGQKEEIARLAHENEALRNYCEQLKHRIAELEQTLAEKGGKG